MIRRSLRSRLLIAASVSIAAALLAAGLGLVLLFERHVADHQAVQVVGRYDQKGCRGNHQQQSFIAGWQLFGLTGISQNKYQPAQRDHGHKNELQLGPEEFGGQLGASQLHGVD